MKMTLLDPEGADLVAEAVLDLLEGEDVDLIGGIELGAVPLVAAICVKSSARGRPLPAFIVRKRAKGHGTDQVIEGFVREGARAVVFDDVTTTGGSVLAAAEAARAAGCRVSKAITIVDRLEGAAENLAKHGLELVPLFTRQDFVD
jgi:orotate phosphoribosyltransferase